MMQEPLPLATIFHEVLSFVAKREDAVVFGAHAVNVYCEPPADDGRCRFAFDRRIRAGK